MMQTTTKWEFYKTSGMGWALSLMKKAYFIAESVNCWELHNGKKQS